ncbi:50S ribosomal protein L27 [Patescibacteria group bacterium]|nr:50S ribosomal protein L27 [Patescibacteria group bacterium]
MAHRKAGGSTELGRDSNPKYLGIKIYGGQKAKAGSIILKQRGTKFRPGINVFKGSDDSLHAKIDGVVEFKEKRIMKYDGKICRAKFVNIV